MRDGSEEKGGDCESQRGNSPFTQSSSSRDDESLKRKRRPPRQPADDLRDIKFNPSEFEGNFNLDLYIEWVQSLERFFEIKEYSQEKGL